MDIHELAKAAADATVPDDANERVKTKKQMWYLARDAALYALEAIKAEDDRVIALQVSDLRRHMKEQQEIRDAARGSSC